MPADRDLPDTQYEQDFASAIASAGEAFRTETTALVDTGWAYGRRLRRRRRASVLAGAAALALVGVGGVAVGSLTGGQGAVPASGASAAPVSGQEFLGMLTDLLPAGKVVEVGEARGTESDTPQLRLTYDDGQGVVQYLFWITHAMKDADCEHTVAPDVCTETTEADGSHVVLYQAGTRSGEPAGSKTWSASLYSKNGYQLMLQEWNRKPLEKDSPVTRADPPLTTDRMAEVVTDRRWARVAAAIPGENRPSVTTTIPGPDGGPGIVVTHESGWSLPSDMASAMVEDAKRKSPATPVPGAGATVFQPPPLPKPDGATPPAGSVTLPATPQSGPVTLQASPPAGSVTAQATPQNGPVTAQASPPAAP